MDWKIFEQGRQIISVSVGYFGERTTRRESRPLAAIIETTIPI